MTLHAPNNQNLVASGGNIETKNDLEIGHFWIRSVFLTSFFLEIQYIIWPIFIIVL